MSRTIDERIVEMQFNNQQFEQNVQTSLGTLEKLKRALDFKGLKNGFDEINASSRRFDMSGVGNAVDNIHSKFSALEIVGVTALVNIANQAVNAGKRMLNSLTIAPISQGFQEYELKMGSVQTIIASTGEKLETVNQYLEDLNTYSDKTIYSFRDMTSNIGKFTNAGVKLKDAVAAIKGVSNVAAVSGANAAEASRAMYNFSQALSSGAVKLIDWKSIENANMSTVEFKDTLIETAVALGTVVKEGDAYRTTTGNLQGKVSELFTSTKGFNEALAHQWMTTDVLTQALELYATDVRELSDAEKEEYEKKLLAQGFNDEQIKRFEELGIKAADAATEVKTFSMLIDTLQEAVGSGWAQTWEILFGDFEEAKKLWTEINDVVGGFIDRTSKARNDLLKAWAGDEFKGREKLIKGLSNAFQALVNIVKPFSDAMAQVFPPLTAKKLSDLTDGFVNFTEKIKNATENFPMKLFGDETVREADTTLSKTVKKTEEATDKIVDNVDHIRQAVRDVVLGKYGNGIPGDRADALAAAGFDPQTVQDYVNKVHELGEGTWDLSDEIMAAAEESLGLTKKAGEEAESVEKTVEDVQEKVEDVVTNENLLVAVLVSVGTGIRNIFESAGKIVGTFADAFSEASSTVTVGRQTVVDFYQAITRFSSRLRVGDGALQKIHNTAKDFFITLKTLAALVVKFMLTNMPAALDIAYSILRVIGEVALGIASFVVSVTKAIVTSETFAAIFDIVGEGFRAIASLVTNAANAFDQFGQKLSSGRSYISNYLREHQTLQKVVNLIGQAFDKARAKIGEFGTSIGGLVGIHSIDDLKKRIDELIDTVSQNFIIPGFENLVSTIDSLAAGEFKLPSITEFFSGLGTEIQKFVDQKTIFDGFEQIVGSIRESFSNFGTLAQQFRDGTIPTMAEFKTAFSDFINSISKNLGEVDWVGVSVVVGQIGALLIGFETIVTIARAVSAGKGLVEAATATMNTVKGFFKKVNGVLDHFTVKKTWEAKFKQVAQAILLLSVSIYLVAQALIQVSKIDQDDLIRAGIVIGSIALVLVAMEIALSKFGKGIEVGTALSIVAFAVAIKLIITAFEDMVDLLLKFEGHGQLLQDAFWDLIILMASMVGVVAALSLIENKVGSLGSAKRMLTVLAFVVALKLLVGVLDDITKLTIGPVLPFLGKLMTAVGTLIVIAWMTKRIPLSSGLGILALVLALKLLVATIDDIAAIDMDAVKANFEAFILVGGLILTLSLILAIAGANAAKAGIGILAIALAINLMVGVIKSLGTMDPQTAAKGVMALQGLMVSIGLLMFATAFAGQYAIRAGVSILLISIALNLMVLPIFLLGSMNASTAAKGVIALLALMAGITVLLIATRAAGENAIQAAVAILLITVSINGLVYAVYMLGNIDSAKLFKALAAIGVLSLILSGLMVVSKFTGTSSWAGIVAIAGAITALAVSLVALSMIDQDDLTRARNTIVILGGLMGALMALSKYTSGASMKNIIVIGVVMIALAGSMAGIAYLIKDLNGDNMVKQFSAMAIALTSIGGVLAVLTALKVDPIAAGKAAAAIDIFAIIIGALVGLAGSLEQLTGGALSETFMKAGPVFEAIGNAIGSLIRGIGTAIFGDQQQAPQKIEEVKTFAERINDMVDTLIEAADKLNGKEASLESLKGLVGVIAAFTKAEFLNGVSEFLGGGKTDFGILGTQLGLLADGLIEFSDKLKDKKIDPQAVDQVLEMAQGLATLYGMDELKSGGFIHQIIGESIGLDKLGEQLGALADGLATYVNKISGYNFGHESIAKSEELLDFVSTIYGKDALKSGGFIQSLVGESIGLNTLGEQLGDLADGLGLYVEKVSEHDFSDENIEKSKTLVDFLSTLAGAPGLKRGGLLGEIIGNSLPLDMFGNQLEGLADGLGKYADKINETKFSDKKREASKTMLQMLADFASNNIPSSGGIVSWIFGGKDLSGFSTALPKLADGLVAYVNKLDEGGFTDEQLGKSVRLTNMLSSLGRVSDQLGDGGKLLTFGSSLTGFSKYLKTFIQDYIAAQASLDGVDIDTFKTTLEEIVTAYSDLVGKLGKLPDDVGIDFSTAVTSLTDSAKTIKDTLDGLKTTFGTSGTDMASSLSKSFSAGVKGFTDAVETAMTNAANTVSGKDVSNKWKTAGETLATALANGVKEKEKDVKTAGETVSKSGSTAAEKTKKDWKNAGENLSAGLASGIRSGKSKAINAAVEVATAAYNAAKSALQINSPSKLFAKLGEGIDEGFAKGMEDKEGLVTGTSVDLVKQMVDASQGALISLADLMSGDIIDDPTITPVLDLSEIQNGSNRLYSMMSDMDRYSFRGNIDLANDTSRSVTRDRNRKQESDNEMMTSLITAINGLSALIGNTGNTYNVNGVTYDDGSNVSSAVRSLIHAAKIGGRV